MNQEERLSLVMNALEVDSDAEMVRKIIQHVANVVVEDIDHRGRDFEVFMRPTHVTGKEIDKLETMFTLREIGIYGDPDLPEDDTYLHMILRLK